MGDDSNSGIMICSLFLVVLALMYRASCVIDHQQVENEKIIITDPDNFKVEP